MHDFVRLSRAFGGRLPMEFEAGRDALAAGHLPEIGHRGCNLEGTVELLFGAECIVSYRIVAGGRMLNLTALSFPKTWGAPPPGPEGNLINGISPGAEDG